MLSTKISEIKCWGGCGEKRTLVAVGGKVEWYSQHAKQYVGSKKKLKLKLPHDPAISL